MSKSLFAALIESMRRMNEILGAECAPSQEFHVDANDIKRLRAKLGLSQPKSSYPTPRSLRRSKQGRANQVGRGGHDALRGRDPQSRSRVRCAPCGAWISVQRAAPASPSKHRSVRSSLRSV
jgi:putative transcriptional regulator